MLRWIHRPGLANNEPRMSRRRRRRRSKKDKLIEVLHMHFLLPGDDDATRRNSKSFQDSASYRILRHIHKVLNIDENKN